MVARAREHVEVEVPVEGRHHRIQKVLRRRIGKLERGDGGVGFGMVLLVPPKLAGGLQDRLVAAGDPRIQVGARDVRHHRLRLRGVGQQERRRGAIEEEAEALGCVAQVGGLAPD